MSILTPPRVPDTLHDLELDRALTTAPPVAPSKPRRKVRRRTALLVTGAVVVGALGVGTAVVLSGGDEAPQPVGLTATDIYRDQAMASRLGGGTLTVLGSTATDAARDAALASRLGSAPTASGLTATDAQRDAAMASRLGSDAVRSAEEQRDAIMGERAAR
jgi:hypothetical protein